MKNKKIVGIVGGMGPEAAADLFRKIIKATPVKNDQEHLRIIIDNNTDIPDRSSAIRGDGPSPVEEIKNSLKILENAGAQVLAMACNTAHYYYDDLKTGVKGDFLHMMDQVAVYIKEKHPTAEKIGVLATEGTINAKLYPSAFAKIDLQVIEPDKESQIKVMEAIYAPWGIKAGYYKEAKAVLKKAAEQLVVKGADIIIMGCTEIPLVLDSTDVQVELLDATTILADAIVAKAFK